MAATLRGGPRTWGGTRDDEGHREFTVVHLVAVSDPSDGPYTVMNCPGLPLIGSEWNFGNDLDIWAFCWPTMKVSIHMEKEGDPPGLYRVEQKFSTKPIPSKRCQDTTIEDPLQEPDRISGSFNKMAQEDPYDKLGNLIKSSSHEIFRGPLVEFDKSHLTVKIEQNRALLELYAIGLLQNCLNDDVLWGYPARCIKFNMPQWERLYYGSCNVYFKRHLEFEARMNDDGTSGWDRDILDEGSKVLKGHWNQQGSWILDNFGSDAPNKNNPNHFIAFHDQKGNQIRAILDGNGLPADVFVDPDETGTGSPGNQSGPAYYHHIEKYPEANLLSLGIPVDLEA